MSRPVTRLPLLGGVVWASADDPPASRAATVATAAMDKAEGETAREGRGCLIDEVSRLDCNSGGNNDGSKPASNDLR